MAKTPPITPAALHQTAASGGSGHSRWFCIGFYALAAVWGVRSVYDTHASMLDLIMPIAMAVCLGWWAVTDARRRGHPIPILAKPWFFLLAAFVVPGYVIWSRGLRGVGWVALHAFLWFVVCTVTLVVAGLLIFGKAWLQV